MISVEWGKRVLLVVGTRQDFARRILAAFSGIPEDRLLLADLNDDEMERIKSAQGFIDGLEMWIGGADEMQASGGNNGG